MSDVWDDRRVRGFFKMTIYRGTPSLKSQKAGLVEEATLRTQPEGKLAFGHSVEGRKATAEPKARGSGFSAFSAYTLRCCLPVK